MSGNEGDEPCVCGTDFTCMADHAALRVEVETLRIALEGASLGWRAAARATADAESRIRAARAALSMADCALPMDSPEWAKEGAQRFADEVLAELDGAP